MSVSCFAYVATRDELVRLGKTLGVNSLGANDEEFSIRTAEAIFEVLPGRVRLRLGRMNGSTPMLMYVLGKYNTTLEAISPRLLATMEKIFERKPVHMYRDESMHWINGEDRIYTGSSIK